jgi:hypothetical protein
LDDPANAGADMAGHDRFASGVNSASRDRGEVLTGSFNFSNNATHSAENVVKSESRTVADACTDYIATLMTRCPEKGL